MLFVQDQEALLALPSDQFDPVQYEVRKANKYGHVQVAQNTYAAGPSFATRQVSVELRQQTIELLEEQGKMTRSFPRVFGYHPETISEPSVVLGHWRASLARGQIRGSAPCSLTRSRTGSIPPIRRTGGSSSPRWTRHRRQPGS